MTGRVRTGPVQVLLVYAAELTRPGTGRSGRREQILAETGHVLQIKIYKVCQTKLQSNILCPWTSDMDIA